MTSMPPPPALSMAELENTVRNGKKKLYWSAYEVVVSSSPSAAGEPRQETRFDAYQVNHNSLKKLHNGARGASYVRVECKYCTSPRFTQSITVSTKKFEEHYMSMHALDALASANTKKAEQLKLNPAETRTAKSPKTKATSEDGNDDDDEEEEEGEEEEEEEEEEESVDDVSESGKRSRVDAGNGASTKRRRRGALTKDDDDHVAAMAGAAAAVVALSGSGNGNGTTSTTDTPASAATTTGIAPASTADGSVTLNPAESDTKRAKKVYWTAYEVVLSQRSSSGQVEETRQDAWRVNHNALRRLHLDPASDTSVRVECKFCSEPKFSQSITVSTRKFEHHYYLEHGNAGERQAVEDALLKKAAEVAFKKAVKHDGTSESTEAIGLPPRRRKSWKAMLLERETSKAVGVAATPVLPPQRESVLNWLLQELLPLESIDSSEFSMLFPSLQFTGGTEPLSQALEKQLRKRHATRTLEIKAKLSQELPAGGSVVLSVHDMVVRDGGVFNQSRVRMYWAISVHFVSQTWTRERVLLACRRVEDPQTEACVHDVVHNVLNDVGIAPSTVFAVISRSPSTFRGVFSQSSRPPLLLHCAADALYAVASAGSSNWQNACATASPSSAIATLLGPFVRVAEDLTRASYATMPMVYQYFRHVRESLQANAAALKNSSTGSTGTEMAAAMQQQLDKVYDSVVTVDVLVACVLDPRFRFSLVAPSDQSRVRERLDAVLLGTEETSANQDVVAEPTAGVDKPARSLFEELATSSKRANLGSTPTASNAELTDELNRYLAMTDENFGVDVFQWWATHEAQLPGLAVIVRKYLALIGTSLPAEEAFTPAGQQLAVRRSVLQGDLLEAYVVTRAPLSFQSTKTTSTMQDTAPAVSTNLVVAPQVVLPSSTVDEGLDVIV